MIAILLPLSLLQALSSAQIPAPDNNLHIYALPVGQGDATVIQCPAQFGGSLVVVDMGSTKYNGFMDKDSVRTWLNGQKVVAVFLTHPDKDHFNMMNAIGVNIPNSLPIYHTCEAGEYVEVSMDMAEWNAKLYRIGKCVADDLNCNYGLPSCPTYAYCEEQLVLRILVSELNDCAGGGENFDSMGVKVEYRGKSALVLGDLEDKNDNPVSTNGNPYNVLLRCANVGSNFLRLAHHGAYGRANKNRLLYQINPNVVFSSSGFNSQFRHPRCEIYNYFYGWLDLTNDPSVNVPNLVKDDSLLHWYTCGGDPQGGQLPWMSGRIREAIYTTSVCDTGSVNNMLRNFVIRMSVDSNNGQLSVDQAQFSAYTRDQYPPGEDKFPCQ